MTDLKFNCPQCQQPLESPEEMLGTIIDCPSCGSRIKIPQRHVNSSFQTLPPASAEPYTNVPLASREIPPTKPNKKMGYSTALRIVIAALLLVVIGLSVTVAALVRHSTTKDQPADERLAETVQAQRPAETVQAQRTDTVQDAREYLDHTLSYMANNHCNLTLCLYPIADYEIISIAKEAPNASEQRQDITNLFSYCRRIRLGFS